MCYPDWDDAVVERWGGYTGLTCHLLLIKMRGILRISFSTRAARDNLVMILDTIADESATFVDQDTRFPVEYMIPTSSGPIATLLCIVPHPGYPRATTIQTVPTSRCPLGKPWKE